MLEAEDIRWLKTTANELNNLLQVISESTAFSLEMDRHDPEREKYASMARTSVDRAAHLVKMMIKRTGQREVSRFADSPFRPAPFVPTAPPAIPSIPAEKNPGVALADKFPEIQIENPQGDNELVMIVDDEDFVSLLAQRVLTNSGYKVVRAKDGMIAIDLYSKLKEEIGLIILDFTMPVLDGAEVFDQLRQINPRAPVVLSSGFTEQNKLKFMLAKGLRGFIPKPYTQEKLLFQVRHTLDAIKNEKRL